MSSNLRLSPSREQNETAGVATLSIVHLVLGAQHGLKSDGVQNLSDADRERIISNFERDVIAGSQPSIQSRSRSVLAMLDLPRAASRIASSAQRGESHDGKGWCIAALASVIGRCLAPLEAKLARSTKEPSRASNLRLSSADNRARSALLLDAAMENHPSASDELRDRFVLEADSRLRESFEMLTAELGRMGGGSIGRLPPLPPSKCSRRRVADSVALAPSSIRGLV